MKISQKWLKIGFQRVKLIISPIISRIYTQSGLFVQRPELIKQSQLKSLQDALEKFGVGKGDGQLNLGQLDLLNKQLSLQIANDSKLVSKGVFTSLDEANVALQESINAWNKVTLKTTDTYTNRAIQAFKDSGEDVSVNITQFKRYTQKQTNVNYQLYVPFAISWVISGDRSLAFNSNKGAVERTERNSNILGLISYFANDYLQYYQYTNGDILTDLTTYGTEYKLEKTGKPYTGLYHIQPDKGPMVGAKHVKTPHDYLVPIKQFITPKRMVSTRNVRSAPMTRRTFRSGGGY